MVGPPLPPVGGAPPAPGAPPVGSAPGGAPPAAWYSLVMMGLHTPSSSFCLSANSSFSASWKQEKREINKMLADQSELRNALDTLHSVIKQFNQK